MRPGGRLRATMSSVGKRRALSALALGTVCLAAGVALGATSPPTSQRVYTPGDVALRNLSAKIDGTRRIVRRHPARSGDRAALVGALLERATFTGRVADYDEALSLSGLVANEAAEATSSQPETPGALAAQALLQARVLAALHRFDEAQDRLDAAERFGAPIAALQRERDTITLATDATAQIVDDIVARRWTLVRERPGMRSETLLAAALAAQGRLRAADERLARALTLNPDVSPFPAARIAFQRGVLAGEWLGDDDAALEHYREAVRLVPAFVRASVHLAELEASGGQPTRAKARLERVRASQDPEPAFRLAPLSETDAARRALRVEVEAAYRRLMRDHRDAYLDHALEVAIELDPEAAVAMARELLSKRNVPRSYLLAIDAEVAAGNHQAALAVAERAAPLAARHPVLRARIAELRSNR